MRAPSETLNIRRRESPKVLFKKKNARSAAEKIQNEFIPSARSVTKKKGERREGNYPHWREAFPKLFFL